MLERFFGGKGACRTICNATIGLLPAVKEAVGEPAPGQCALMPSFTFAAAAHTAIWCGLTPLFCDIHPQTWAADLAVEAKMLRDYAGKIALVLPYATFSHAIDLERYTCIAAARDTSGGSNDREFQANEYRGSRFWLSAAKQHTGLRSVVPAVNVHTSLPAGLITVGCQNAP